MAAGVLCHMLQGFAAFLFFDRLYLQNAELARDAGRMVGLAYLVVNLGVGIVIAALTWYLHKVWTGDDWQVGMKTGIIIWAASSPVFILKRQIILSLSQWLLLEIVTDLIIYAFIGAVAGLLIGRGAAEPHQEAT
ncbi:MAG: hypothetical protein GYA46_00470 [candidate division Zixibacteria bacterium]|nr:hypothetical protein [candidate division Zixibacteria bacterium]